MEQCAGHTPAYGLLWTQDFRLRLGVLQKGHSDHAQQGGACSTAAAVLWHEKTLRVCKELLRIDPAKRPCMREALGLLVKLEKDLWAMEGVEPLLQVVVPRADKEAADMSQVQGMGAAGKAALERCLSRWRQGVSGDARAHAVELGMSEAGFLVIRGPETLRHWVRDGVLHEYLKDGGVMDEQTRRAGAGEGAGGAAGRAVGGAPTLWERGTRSAPTLSIFAPP